MTLRRFDVQRPHGALYRDLRHIHVAHCGRFKAQDVTIRVGGAGGPLRGALGHESRWRECGGESKNMYSYASHNTPHIAHKQHTTAYNSTQQHTAHSTQPHILVAQHTTRSKSGKFLSPFFRFPHLEECEPVLDGPEYVIAPQRVPNRSPVLT